jgi:hypothetical protein
MDSTSGSTNMAGIAGILLSLTGSPSVCSLGNPSDSTLSSFLCDQGDCSSWL